MSKAEDRNDAEARRLVQWAFDNAAYYRKNAPLLVDDIQSFEDAGALIDTYRAGLVLVDPHPAMRAELIRWVLVEDQLPNAEEMVLLWREGDEAPWTGYLSGKQWFSALGFVFRFASVTHWAKLPAGPTPVTEEPAA